MLHLQRADLKYPTARRFPAFPLSASRPPGPILLLRDSLPVGLFEVVRLNIPAESIVRFSLSPLMSGEGMCAIDLRARGRAADAFGLWGVAILMSRLHQGCWNS